MDSGERLRWIPDFFSSLAFFLPFLTMKETMVKFEVGFVKVKYIFIDVELAFVFWGRGVNSSKELILTVKYDFFVDIYSSDEKS